MAERRLFLVYIYYSIYYCGNNVQAFKTLLRFSNLALRFVSYL